MSLWWWVASTELLPAILVPVYNSGEYSPNIHPTAPPSGLLSQNKWENYPDIWNWICWQYLAGNGWWGVTVGAGPVSDIALLPRFWFAESRNRIRKQWWSAVVSYGAEWPAESKNKNIPVLHKQNNICQGKFSFSRVFRPEPHSVKSGNILLNVRVKFIIIRMFL